MNSRSDLANVVRVLSVACDGAEANNKGFVSVPVDCLRAVLKTYAPLRPPLTRRQRAVYAALRLCIVDRGYYPTFEELAMRLNLKSLATVSEHLDNLERAGYISRPEDRKKGARCPITLVPPVLP